MFVHGGQTFFTYSRDGGGQTFYVGGSGGYDDIDKEINVSKEDVLVSEVSKFSAAA